MDRAAHVVQIAGTVLDLQAFGPDPAKIAQYLAFLGRPGEDPAGAAAYYRSKGLSTCALTVLAIWRLAGCLSPECAAPYYPGRVGKAFSDVQGLATRYGAWDVGRPTPLLAGDAWVITDGVGGDGHMGLAVADEAPDGTVHTVEGGQLDSRGGSSAIGAFTRTLRPQGAGVGRVWMMGARHIYGVARCAALPIPDVNDGPLA